MILYLLLNLLLLGRAFYYWAAHYFDNFEECVFTAGAHLTIHLAKGPFVVFQRQCVILG